MATIRRASYADIPSIVDMGRKFYETTDYAPAFCSESVESLARTILDSGFILIADRGGIPCGMAAMLVAPFPFNMSVKTACEVAWWVDYDARGEGVGRALFHAIEPAARELGVSQIEMIHLQGSPPQARDLYLSDGFVPTHTSYTKVL